jgi:hypothetical protein
MSAHYRLKEVYQVLAYVECSPGDLRSRLNATPEKLTISVG